MTDSPPPIQYRAPPPADAAPWSPVPVMVAVTMLAIVITAMSAFVSLHMVPLFRAFKVELPLVTRISVTISRLIWDDFGWIPLLLAAILLPMTLIPRLPVPPDQNARRRIAMFTRLLLVVTYLVTAGFVVVSLFAPMIALINSVSGPAKK